MNRKQRETLKFFSEQVYGVSSRWQKMMTDPQYRVVTSRTETDSMPEYIYYTDPASGGKTVVTTSKAVKNGYVLPENLPGRVDYEWRSPTHDEMIAILLKKRFEIAESFLNESDFTELVALYLRSTDALYPGVSLFCKSQEDLDKAKELFGDNEYINNRLTLLEKPGTKNINALTLAYLFKLEALVSLDETANKIEKFLQLATMNRDGQQKQIQKMIIHQRFAK
jgi:hypothetical protein